MQNTLEKFDRLVRELLEDESKQPVADFVPSGELYNTLDLSLNEEGVSEEAFEKALKELVFKTPRTATNAFFNQLFGGRNEESDFRRLNGCNSQ